MVYCVSFFDSEQHKILSGISLHAENFTKAKDAAIGIIPNNTQMIMLIPEGSTVDKAIWYWVGCGRWRDNSGKAIKF